HRMALPDPMPFLPWLARLGGLVVAAPLFGHLLVPMRVRAAMAVLFATALSPLAPAVAELPTSLWQLRGAIACEAALGTLMGIVAQLVFAGVQLGRQLAGVPLGLSMADLIDPAAPTHLHFIP